MDGETPAGATVVASGGEKLRLFDDSAAAQCAGDMIASAA